MTHIPRAFCACGFEMLPAKSGVKLETIARIGSYYKIMADLHRCPNCGNGAYLGMTRQFAEHYQSDYAAKPVDEKVYFAETLQK